MIKKKTYLNLKLGVKTIINDSLIKKFKIKLNRKREKKEGKSNILIIINCQIINALESNYILLNDLSHIVSGRMKNLLGACHFHFFFFYFSP